MFYKKWISFGLLLIAVILPLTVYAKASANALENAKATCNKATTCYTDLVANAGDKSTATLIREKDTCDRIKKECDRLLTVKNKPPLNLHQAYDADQQAFKHYTSLVTTAKAGESNEVQKALKAYRNAYAEYKKLKTAQTSSKQPPKNKPLNTTGVDGIIDIDPADVENNIEYIEGLRKRDHPQNISNNNKTKDKSTEGQLTTSAAISTIDADRYRYGIGVKANQFKAFKLYQHEANKGNPDAMVELSDFYEQGVVIPKNHSKAIKLLQQAVTKGSLIAKWQLSTLTSED